MRHVDLRPETNLKQSTANTTFLGEELMFCLIRGTMLPGQKSMVYLTVFKWRLDQSMVGMENSAPSLIPEGQREVMVLVRV